MERVVVGDAETPADDPQVEAQEAVAEEPQEVQPQEESEKPDWLPDKFAHPEELAKAYGQLEKKLFIGAEVPKGYCELKPLLCLQ